MNYTLPYPSSVPHIVLVPQTITMSLQFYAISLGIQIIFALTATLFFILSLYFSCKGEKSIDHEDAIAVSENLRSESEDGNSNNNLICLGKLEEDGFGQNRNPKVIEKREEEQDAEGQGQNATFGDSFWNMTAGGLGAFGLGKRADLRNSVLTTGQGVLTQTKEVIKTNQKKHRLNQRRFIYFTTYLAIYVVCVNSFDSSIYSAVAIIAQFVIFCCFNVFRKLKEWKIVLLFYILPSVLVFYEYLQGNHRLYSWEPVM